MSSSDGKDQPGDKLYGHIKKTKNRSKFLIAHAVIAHAVIAHAVIAHAVIATP